MSLPSPLTASDEWVKARDTTLDVVRVTAGLHRQVWVSGTSIYVDVHIMNNSRKTIKKIELLLERDILCYKHVCLATVSLVHPGILMKHICRLLHRLWRNLLVRLASLTTTSAQSSAKLLSNKAQLAGMESLRIKPTSVPAISRCLVGTLRSSVVCDSHQVHQKLNSD